MDNLSKDFLKEGLDLDARQKNLDKLEENVQRIQDIQELYKSLNRRQRRKLFPELKFSKRLDEAMKNKSGKNKKKQDN